MARKLFERCSSEDWRRRSVIAGGSHYHRTYVPSYYEAAETLVQAVLQHNGRADLLFCPAVHLYHHFVELMLKRLVPQADANCADSQQRKGVPPKLEDTHDLHCLLGWLIERLEAIDDKGPFNDGVRGIIEDLHNFNGPTGEATRYAFSKPPKKQQQTKERKRTRTLPTRQQFDIETLGSRMKEVHDYLCGIEDWLDSMRQTE